MIEKIRANKDANYGFNAATGGYEDLVKAGVIDPTKVTRSALQNAASISALMLTTEAMICEIPEKKSLPPMGGEPRRWRRDGLLATCVAAMAPYGAVAKSEENGPLRKGRPFSILRGTAPLSEPAGSRLGPECRSDRRR